MFASTSYSRLPPTTPPSSIYHDGVSIFQSSDSIYLDSSYEEEVDDDLTDLTSASCQMYYPHASSSTYTLAPLAPPALQSIPSPFIPYVPPPQLAPIPPFQQPRPPLPSLDLSIPGLLEETDEMPGRVTMDMGMAPSGSEPAQAGIHTPLAAYAGTS